MAADDPATHATEHCPAWCVVDHQPDDFPDDRYHDTVSTYVDVILKTSDSAESGEIMIVTSRRFGEREDWTFIGEPDRNRQRLELSRESAQRLATALDLHLGMLDEASFRDRRDATDT